jgi:diguanylate cyclase (GGDEF)-like protein/putative nucleotidyltransferase with HDIG domain
MISETTVAIILLLASALSTGFFAYMHSLRRQTYVTLWTVGWCLLALHHLGPALDADGITSPLQMVMTQWFLAAAALVFFSSAKIYVQGQLWVRGLVAASAIFVLWAAAFTLHRISVGPEIGVAFVLAGTAWVFYQESRFQETFVDLLLAISFLSWAAVLIGEVIVGPEGAPWMHVFGIVPQVVASALMIMALYEEEKRRIERNMLALSNVNLATSTFTGSEIQTMLFHALERVLNVAGMPAGALLLHHGSSQGPTSVVAVGLSEDFCSIAQEEGLDDHLVELVSRMGGVVVFRDLIRNSSKNGGDGEDATHRFRRLANRQGLSTIVGVSLHAKDRAFGALILGSPELRRFTAAELRMLLALGHQIGMAVENSYLVQQSARRSDGLRMLNEIGRVLGSTLEPDALYATISTEMKRLFNMNHFFIAVRDDTKNEINFEVEVRDGVTQPKRSRPAGMQHLPEYVMRTRQPLLIREQYAKELESLGLTPHLEYACLCAAPLLVGEKAIGVIAVQSPQEHAFDESTLEMMRVLSSEVVVALENVRLFREERTKSRRLTLLNNISRNMITTLKPDEMLFKIAEELNRSLDYSHIGIALMDYVKKDFVVQAEAGQRKGAWGKRLKLTGNIVGRVASSGHTEVANYLDSTHGSDEPVIAGSVSSIALPIIYADHLHGVLYVETDRPTDFGKEEASFLGTLADLVSGALHNASAFQKTQQEAITDGLTGVKTHRFFMEALSGEWKRATRTSRPFSLILMDLDRFKFVNDFYGHVDGDNVIQRVAQLLSEHCRRSDVVARYGGDEFVILMPETDLEQAHLLAGKLRNWIATDPLLLERNVTSSLGVATFPIHGSTPQELIQVADASMYLSKHRGGNAVSTADHVDPDERKKWKSDVLEAYLGVTLKRLFTTGPSAFEEIRNRIEQFARSVSETELERSDSAPNAEGPCEPLPPIVMDTLTSLALAVDSKDQFTQGHSQKVAGYAVVIAEAIGLGSPEVEEIRLGAMLHDIGKVGISDTILNKNGPLDAEQWEVMKKHVDFGSQLLEPLNGTERIRAMVAHHHEFFDGSGYPSGLAGKQIPFGARIITIADAYDTITSQRTYKQEHSSEDAFKELERCAGTQFDPELVKTFIERVQKLPNPLLESALAGPSKP